MLPEEQELARLEAEQAQLQDQLASAELTLKTIKTETATFQHRYYRTVGRLYAELDALDAELARLKLRQNPTDTAIREQARAAEQRAKKSSEEVGLFKAEREPPPTIGVSVKEAYRRAVKLLHPDLATNERERQRRTELMVLVNLAYERGNQATIEKLMKDFRQGPDAITGDDIGARLVKTIRRNAQLRQRLNEVQEEIETQKRSEIFVLRQRVEGAEAKGGNPLGDLAKQLIQQIAERKSKLRAAATDATTGAVGRSMVV
jgi:hypothetical protein